MTPPDSILELIDRFDRNRAAYRGGHYNETQARREFIDPFFEALGWDVARHDQMVALVERMLDLHKRAAAEQVPHVKTLLQRQIEATDRQIDLLVYQLYELSDAEINVVEDAASKSKQFPASNPYSE